MTSRVKVGAFTVALGVALIVLFSCVYQNQSEWLCVNAKLSSVSKLKPYDGNYCYGNYTVSLNGKTVDLRAQSVSSKDFIKDNVIFYINPENYNDYHVEYTYSDIFVKSFSGVLLILLGIFMLKETKK